MAAFIEVAYDRQYTDADVQTVAARAGVTLSVLTQLGVAYQTLPGFAMVGYQTETTALTTDLMALQALVDQIRPLLISIDAKAKPLDEKNKGILRALQGLLQKRRRHLAALPDHRPNRTIRRKHSPHAAPCSTNTVNGLRLDQQLTPHSVRQPSWGPDAGVDDEALSDIDGLGTLKSCKRTTPFPA